MGSAIVRRKEHRFNELIQPIEVNVGQDGTHYAALRCTAERRVELPGFQVSRPKQVLDQPHEAAVVKFFAQDRQHDFVVEAVETLRDIAFNEPGGPHPCLLDFPECMMASAPSAEAI